MCQVVKVKYSSSKSHWVKNYHIIQVLHLKFILSHLEQWCLHLRMDYPIFFIVPGNSNATLWNCNLEPLNAQLWRLFHCSGWSWHSITLQLLQYSIPFNLTTLVAMPITAVRGLYVFTIDCIYACTSGTRLFDYRWEFCRTPEECKAWTQASKCLLL